jgi:hypothetical protein
MHLMRPEKEWRPVVTIDGGARWEVVMGVDGQNPNSRAGWPLPASPAQLEIRVWYCRTGKKRRRVLVAAGEVGAGELVKRWEREGPGRRGESFWVLVGLGWGC